MLKKLLLLKRINPVCENGRGGERLPRPLFFKDMIEMTNYQNDMINSILGVVLETERAKSHEAEILALPSSIYKPTLFIDGNQWCALYGSDIQKGVAGFGSSPKEAMDAFDKAWLTPLEAPIVHE